MKNNYDEIIEILNRQKEDCRWLLDNEYPGNGETEMKYIKQEQALEEAIEIIKISKKSEKHIKELVNYIMWYKGNRPSIDKLRPAAIELDNIINKED